MVRGVVAGVRVADEHRVRVGAGGFQEVELLQADPREQRVGGDRRAGRPLGRGGRPQDPRLHIVDRAVAGRKLAEQPRTDSHPGGVTLREGTPTKRVAQVTSR